MNSLILTFSFIVCMVLKVPVAIAIGITSVAFVFVSGSIPPFVIIQRMVAALDSFTLLAIPLYLFVGNIMNSGGITRRIFNFCLAICGHWKGSLAYVNVLCSIIFAGMSGAALADVAGIGMIEIKSMDLAGFPRPFSAALTAVTSTIGPIIPPSIPLLIYGGLAEVSIGRLFMAGAVPGLILGIAFILAIYIIARRRNFPVSKKATFKQFLLAFWDAIPSLLTIVIILGGIMSGFFTPTEAAGIAAAWGLFLAICYREVTVKSLIKDLLNTAITSGTIMFIFAVAATFGYIITLEKIPEMVSAGILSLTTNKYIILITLNIILLFMGMFLDTNSILAIAVPIFVPLALSIGVDAVHFGIIIVLNLMIGGITPPFCMLYFVVCNVAKIDLVPVVKAGMPFFWTLIIVLVVATAIPQISLFLPTLIFG